MDSQPPRDAVALPPGSERAAPPARTDAAPVHAPAGALDVPVVDERRVLAIAGETRRVGRWAVPRRLVVRAYLGEVWVDLRESEIPEGFVLDVRARGARVTLVVPPGVAVLFDVFAVLGNAINQADEPTTLGNRAWRTIHVAGSAVLGEVRVLVRGPAGEPRPRA